VTDLPSRPALAGLLSVPLHHLAAFGRFAATILVRHADREDLAMAVGTEIQLMAQITEATKKNAAATLAAALITASGRAHSVGEAVKLMHDIEWTLWPSPSHGAYQAWKKTFDPDAKHE
jgi:hypothetical protein